MSEKIEDFFNHRENLRQKYEYPGTFKDYAQEIAQSVSGAPQTHKSIMNRFILAETGRILPGEISQEALAYQLSHYPILSTADHHGLLNYELLYNSNILYAEIIKKIKMPFVVVAATGNVPLTNISYPRGFYFKGEKFNFFSERKSKVPVFLFQSKLSATRGQGIQSLVTNIDNTSITPEERKFLEHLFFDCLEIETVSRRYETFSDQVTYLNYRLWKYYFHKSMRDSVPDIIYLQVNRILVKTLLEEIKKEDSLISLILFDPDVRLIFFKNFYDIQGAWKDEKGTKFFWGIPGNKQFVTLEIDLLNNSLKGKDFCIELRRGAIIEALSAGKLIPSLFLTFLIITFLEGYVALGGSNQVDYLPKMQRALIKSLGEIGLNGLVDRFAGRVTDGLICGMLPFDFAGGIDLLWHYNSSGGTFNGNLDGGIAQEDLDRINNTAVREMLGKGIQAMMEIV